MKKLLLTILLNGMCFVRVGLSKTTPSATFDLNGVIFIGNILHKYLTDKIFDFVIQRNSYKKLLHFLYKSLNSLYKGKLETGDHNGWQSYGSKKSNKITYNLALNDSRSFN